MKRIFIALLIITLIGCKGKDRMKADEKVNKTPDTSSSSNLSLDNILDGKTVELNLEEANKLVTLPLACIATQYPNKLNQTLSGEGDIKPPKELHPAFYGCFDWHSSVHAHWSLVRLLKEFPDLDKAEEIKTVLENSLSKENIQGEMDYFKKENNQDYERTYGWAWLLKLTEELSTWDTDLGAKLYTNVNPLADLIVNRFSDFLPKLNYPIRVGEHTNTAFSLSFAYDFAKTTGNTDFQGLIEKRAKDFYLKDDNCPMAWEPSGFDFLSPCLEEVDVMRKVLSKAPFSLWIDDFMPQLKKPEFSLEPGKVSDRTDGKLVHLDGLNFSRAWVLYGLANQYPEQYGHLKKVANQQVSASFSNIMGDDYAGGHWLGTFAIYALEQQQAKSQSE